MNPSTANAGVAMLMWSPPLLWKCWRKERTQWVGLQVGSTRETVLCSVCAANFSKSRKEHACPFGCNYGKGRKRLPGIELHTAVPFLYSFPLFSCFWKEITVSGTWRTSKNLSRCNTSKEKTFCEQFWGKQYLPLYARFPSWPTDKPEFLKVASKFVPKHANKGEGYTPRPWFRNS